MLALKIRFSARGNPAEASRRSCQAVLKSDRLDEFNGLWEDEDHRDWLAAILGQSV